MPTRRETPVTSATRPERGGGVRGPWARRVSVVSLRYRCRRPLAPSASLVITHHLRTLRLTDSLIGFYDGRVPGQAFASEPNWVDDGALQLGICSYALVDGGEALVYDTHVSVEHAAFIRSAIEELGAKRITVVLSHWHLDHVAGTAAFADCEVVANTLTADLLTRHSRRSRPQPRGPPAISPLVLPTTTSRGAATSTSAGSGWSCCSSTSTAATRRCSISPEGPPAGRRHGRGHRDIRLGARLVWRRISPSSAGCAALTSTGCTPTTAARRRSPPAGTGSR